MTDMHDLAMQIRYDLTAAQSKLTELMRQIGEQPDHATNTIVCPRCTIALAGPRALAEHLDNVHGASDPLVPARASLEGPAGV